VRPPLFSLKGLGRIRFRIRRWRQLRWERFCQVLNEDRRRIWMLPFAIPVVLLMFVSFRMGKVTAYLTHWIRRNKEIASEQRAVDEAANLQNH